MYATAHIVLQKAPNAMVLPASAIVRTDKQASCWTVRDAQAVRAPIGLGLQVGGEVEVASGLKGDEMVVQSQAESLRGPVRGAPAKQPVTNRRPVPFRSSAVAAETIPSVGEEGNRSRFSERGRSCQSGGLAEKWTSPLPPRARGAQSQV